MIGDPLRIEDIASELHRGGLNLPEIQRGYVWKKLQVAQLLDSIYRGYPVGSILLWDTCDGVVLREMASAFGSFKPDFLPRIVLDGQGHHLPGQGVRSQLPETGPGSVQRDERSLRRILAGQRR